MKIEAAMRLIVSEVKVGDAVYVSQYDSEGKLPARKPKATITELPSKGSKTWKAKLSSGKEIFLHKNEFST